MRHFLLRWAKRELVESINRDAMRRNQGPMRRPSRHRGGTLYITPARLSRGQGFRLALGGLAAILGAAWALSALPAGGWGAAWRLIVTCVACELILPPRAGPE